MIEAQAGGLDRRKRIAVLRELVRALDRRVPSAGRIEDPQIARDSAALRSNARRQIADLEDGGRRPAANIRVALPGFHMAGSDAHYDAHIEVGPHGFALFLAPDAPYPTFDVNGTGEQLEVVIRGLQAGLAAVAR